MRPLEQLKSLLDAMSYEERHCIVRESQGSLHLQRAGMQAGAREASDELVEVSYEHAPHEVTRVQLPPAPAATFVVAIFSRKEPSLVEVPRV